MAEDLNLPPFPLLSWDGAFWVGRAALPGFAAEPDDLVVLVKWTPDQVDEQSARRPTAAQAAAFQFLQESVEQVLKAVMAAIWERVPEWENEELPRGGWTSPLQFARVTVLTAEWEGVAYTGFEFNSFEFEHGIGVVTHRDRVVHVGMAEEAHDDGSTGAAAQDVRRLKRLEKESRRSR